MQVSPQKADYFHRFIAKLIDLTICAAFAKIIYPVGTFAAVLYILISDGLDKGGSIGKQIIRLKVIKSETGAPCDFRQSLIRNAPIGVIFMLYLIPFIGWFLALAGGLVILSFEAYFILSDEKGLRVGDHLANTIVVEKVPTDYQQG